MSKGLGIRIIGAMTLAMVGVSILLVTFSSNFGGGSDGIFCNTYETVSVVFPGKKSPPPKGCGESRDIEYEVVKVASKERLSLKLSSSVLSCWREHKGYNTSGEFCEGWNVKRLPSALNESKFTKELKQNNLCKERIENSALEHGGTHTCGSKNQIYFGIENISQGDFVVIEYNTTSSGTQRIEVK